MLFFFKKNLLNLYRLLITFFKRFAIVFLFYILFVRVWTILFHERNIRTHTTLPPPRISSDTANKTNIATLRPPRETAVAAVAAAAVPISLLFFARFHVLIHIIISVSCTVVNCRTVAYGLLGKTSRVSPFNMSGRYVYYHSIRFIIWVNNAVGFL